MRTVPSSRGKGLAFACVSHFLASAERRYIGAIRDGDPSKFTRRRKCTVESLLAQCILRRGTSQQSEADEIAKAFPPLEGITASGLFKARAKLGDKAFPAMLRDFAAMAYRAVPSPKTFRGFRLLAVDGCHELLRSDAEKGAEYGKTSNREWAANDPYAVGYCTLYDSLNGIVVDAEIGGYPPKESTMAWSMAERACAGLPHGPFCLIGDRLYFSFALATLLDSHGMRYCFRLKSSDLKEQRASMRGSGSRDSAFLLAPKKASVRNMLLNEPGKHAVCVDPDRLRVRQTLVRVVSVDVVDAATGEVTEEWLATNFDEGEATREELKGLYWGRWPIETANRREKSPLKLGQWTGRKDVWIRQDFYSCLFFLDVVSLLGAEADASSPLPKAAAGEARKFETMPNFNQRAGVVKRGLAEVLFAECVPREKEKKELALLLALGRALTQIRPNRKFKRIDKGNKSRMSYAYAY